MRINLCQQAADMSNLIAIHSKVGAHHAVFGGQSAKSHWLLGAIAVIVTLQPKNGGDCGRVQETKAKRRRTLSRTLNALLTTHGEVAQESCTNHAVVAGALCELIDDLAVTVANLGGHLGMPHGAGQHGLDGVHQPHKIRVGVGNFNLGHLDVGADALRHGTNFQG